MSDLAILLTTDIEKREATFCTKLARLSEELAEEYTALQDLRRALEYIRKDRGKPVRRNGVIRTTFSEPLPHGFVLMEEVRKAIRSIQKPRFRASDVYDILHEKYPQTIAEDKKGTVAATLSNLAAKRELLSEKDGQRKVWYTVAALRGDDSEVQHNLLDAE